MGHVWKASLVIATAVWAAGPPPSARTVSAVEIGAGAWDERMACLIDAPRTAPAEDRACAWPGAAAVRKTRPAATAPCAATPVRDGGSRLVCTAAPPSTVLPVTR